MRTQLLAFVALGLGCGAWSDCYAIDIDRIHLPGPLGHYFGIGYSAGYHAHQPPHPRLNPHAQGFAPHAQGFAVAVSSQVVVPQPQGHAPLPYAPTCQQCPSSSSPEPAANVPQLAPPAALTEASPTAIIHQPSRAASPSDRAGSLQQPQSLRRTPSASATSPVAVPPKTASVPRASILERDAK